MTENIIKGISYVLGHNIDTDQIIPADKLTLDPSKPNERNELGSYALSGLPDEIKEKYPFITEEERQAIADGSQKSPYNIIIAGRGFGCGSSREHAANALGAAGVELVIAKGYARIFYENSVATGDILPVTSIKDISDKFRTGDWVEIDLENLSINNTSKREKYELEPLGYVLNQVKAGGLFAYARQKGLISPRPK